MVKPTKKTLTVVGLKRLFKKRKKLLEEVKNLDEQITSRCPHNFSYECDPSGNNDSGWSCSLCGSFFRTLP